MTPTLQALPASWGSRDQIEKLTPAAASSLSRMIARAVAETSVNFQLNDAYRSKAEQIALFEANYRNRGTRAKKASSDRMYGGTYWARRPDSVAVASPDLYGTGTGANHTRGIAIDIAPAAIQTWIQANGSRFGWTWDEGRRNGEPWHFVYNGTDRYTAEGWLDHAAVQRAVGATVDGKIGTGTVQLIKAKQKQLGLEPDGKVGPRDEEGPGTDGKR
ncbi:peptidoglycan-binding protein [Brachybacterium conglomeratum]|uniref:peptidoglycan-binding protein n=1 Tax=Brachybacterium conglomeratum TaxID=47846 RepID=UPI0036147FB7